MNNAVHLHFNFLAAMKPFTQSAGRNAIQLTHPPNGLKDPSLIQNCAYTTKVSLPNTFVYSFFWHVLPAMITGSTLHEKVLCCCNPSITLLSYQAVYSKFPWRHQVNLCCACVFLKEEGTAEINMSMSTLIYALERQQRPCKRENLSNTYNVLKCTVSIIKTPNTVAWQKGANCIVFYYYYFIVSYYRLYFLPFSDKTLQQE